MNNFDPDTLWHWLYFRLKCYEVSGAEFQRLFEEIMKRHESGFIRVKPYGIIGDKKSDGVFSLGKTVFQVYSPEELTLSEVKQKINDDLKGAVEHWSNSMEKWVFVFNTRFGLAPDIPLLLSEKKSEYPEIVIESISNDDLWTTMCELSAQQRAEILGPAISASEDSSKILDSSFITLIHDLMSPINIVSTNKALGPKGTFGFPYHIKPQQADWPIMAEMQKQIVEDLLEKVWNLSPCFAVFSLSPIPLAVHLGFILSNRVEVECFQFDRDARSWNWPDTTISDADLQIEVTGTPTKLVNANEVVVSVSLSADIRVSDITAVIKNPELTINLRASSPSLSWLQHPQQITEFTKVFRRVLEDIRKFVPSCNKIHLFYAGPVGPAIKIGQEINPRMTPPVQTYQFSMQQTPHYSRAILIEESIDDQS